jgi:hypothetical protein
MTAVTDAYARYERIRKTVVSARDRALSQPASSRNIEAGYVARGDTSDSARRKLQIIFDEMQQSIEYLGFLEVCAAFEDAFRKRAATAVGEVRRVVDQHYELNVLNGLKARFVREPLSFESLASIFAFLDGLVSTDMGNALKLIREERNRIAHGSDLQQPIRVTVREAADLLNELIAQFW